MSEAVRDAYAQACSELDAASTALEAAQARVQAARLRCEKLEAALGMTRLSDGFFPQIDCAEAEEYEAERRPRRSAKG